MAAYDCIIIGGGPAGLTCAVFLGRYRRRVLVLDAGRGRNSASWGMHGLLGHDRIRPAELRRKGRAEARRYGVVIAKASVTRIRRRGGRFLVESDRGTAWARRVVLAYGVSDVLPQAPGFGRLYGKSIFHCPDCDGFEVTGKRVGIIGRGQAGAALALKLLQWTPRVRLFTDGEPPDLDRAARRKLAAAAIGVEEDPVRAFVGRGGKLEALALASGRQVALEALFFNLGRRFSCALAEDLGCPTAGDPLCIPVNAHKETAVPGLYAIGDLVAGTQLVVTAAADGAIAAIAIQKSLLPSSRVL